ncbi:cadherin-86C-like [Penaeus japonicus]|uniref:cadherin-86C-like n=1 Tax=Penaeus japonicus TaxID=27405 RepID=UPI001C712644|nr:cadherin-86C-like [Penaeus japonicus]
MARWARRHPPLPPGRPQAWRRRVAQLAAALAFLVALWVPASATVPQFFEADKMAALRLAADTAVGELIYRLRASDADRDYPLTFSIGGKWPASAHMGTAMHVAKGSGIQVTG